MKDKIINTLKLAKKPSKREFIEYTKLIFIGIGLLGSIGFVIWYIFDLFIVV
ncbi:MAG TPA: protein translocase SEC61 complex subunit gamma [Thermoprotei archaeon]|nr:protein translocase SEC61 complex subunit gamma [Thermoprotei archaeon]